MPRAIKLVGLDCGSTTTSAVVASATLVGGAVGRVEISGLQPVFRSEMIFTPLAGNDIDGARLAANIDGWLADAGVARDEIFAGGALVTGLAAQRNNAAEITRLIEARMADTVVATADDPRLESWLAFMGNCQALSAAHPDTPILNLDIGGGTTNLAWGIGGQVLATACLFVGARHFQFVPGGYQLTALSPYATTLLEHLQIAKGVGDVLSTPEVDAILDFYLKLIEATVAGDQGRLATSIASRHVQAAPRPAQKFVAPMAVTLSGGVGELAYAVRRGEPATGVTHFGDLGGELAERIARWPRFADTPERFVPTGLGRATVYGLLRHSTELSGTTIYLPHPERLPLKNVPIVARIGPATTDAELTAALDLASHSVPAGCVAIDGLEQNLAPLKALGNRLADALAAGAFPSKGPLVLLVAENLGKVFGSYATRWGTLDVDLIAIDEVPPRDAQFIRLGKPREGTVPVWLYGMR